MYNQLKGKSGKIPRGHAAVKEEFSIDTTGKLGRFGE